MLTSVDMYWISSGMMRVHVTFVTTVGLSSDNVTPPQQNNHCCTSSFKTTAAHLVKLPFCLEHTSHAEKTLVLLPQACVGRAS
jgi:hypothetical protein